MFGEEEKNERQGGNVCWVLSEEMRQKAMLPVEVPNVANWSAYNAMSTLLIENKHNYL